MARREDKRLTVVVGDWTVWSILPSDSEIPFGESSVHLLGGGRRNCDRISQSNETVFIAIDICEDTVHDSSENNTSSTGSRDSSEFTVDQDNNDSNTVDLTTKREGAGRIGGGTGSPIGGRRSRVVVDGVTRTNRLSITVRVDIDVTAGVVANSDRVIIVVDRRL